MCVLALDVFASIAPCLTRRFERPTKERVEAADKRLVEQETTRIELLVEAAYVTAAL